MAFSMLGDANEATLLPVSEAEFAQWRREQRARVIKSEGRYWEEKPRGFYHAIHWMARMCSSEARSPSGFAWGFRTTLREEDTANANGSMPVHLLSDVQNYDISVLNSKKRNKLRNCRKKVKLVELLQPDLLKQQGYPVYRSAQQRTSYGRKLSLSEFHNTVDQYYNLRNRLILGGLVDGELRGYVLAYALVDTAYIATVNLDSAALSTNIGTCLIYSLVQACRRSGCIREAVYGQDTPEDRSLTQYKVEMGFPVVHVPSRVWLAPVFKTIVRHRRPYSYYRLTGNSTKI